MLGLLVLVLVYSFRDRTPSISRAEGEVIQAVIDQIRVAPNSPQLRVMPRVLPLIMSLEPFPGLDPAFKEAAAKAWESFKPVETTPVLRLDTVALRGVTYRDQPDADFHFSIPIIIGSQSVLEYSDSRISKYSLDHQVMLVRVATGWMVKEDRKLYVDR